MIISAEHTTHRSQPSPMNRHSATSTRFSSVIGSTNFHAKFISWSCRKRGNVPRTQMSTTIESITFEKNQIHDGTHHKNENGADHPPRNSAVPNPEIENIPKYSPKKKSANLNPEYSVKYPATSSDSPSGKSNGERFVSAVAAIANITNPANPHGVKMYQCGSPYVYWFCASTIFTSDNEPVIMTTATLDISSGTS